MARTTYEQYNELRKSFFERHDYDYECETSPMNEYGVYHKEYYFEDGAVWYERMAPTYEQVVMTGEFHGVEITETREIKFLETEFWSTDNSKSLKYYEKF